MAKVSRSLLCQSKLNKTVASVDDAFFHWTRLDSQLTDHTLIAVLYSLPKSRIHSLQCRNEQLAHPHKWLWQILRGNLVALRSELVSNDLRILSHVHSTGQRMYLFPAASLFSMAATWAAATSRTSTTAKFTSGTAGVLLLSICSHTSLEPSPLLALSNGP